jgi:hypothetical protein
VKWEEIDKNKYEHGIYGMFLSYFDINNDGVEEGVFLKEGIYKIYEMLHLDYTTKEDAKIVTKYELKNNWQQNKKAELQKLSLIKNKYAYINNNFGVFFLRMNEIIKDNLTNRIFELSIICPEPFPMKFNNQYYIAVFGTKESSDQLKYIPLYTMHNNGNRVALVKYNPDNSLMGICGLDRANPNTKKYLKYNK